LSFSFFLLIHMSIIALGIDLAKNTYRLHGEESTGKAILKKRTSRNVLAALFQDAKNRNLKYR
ncbi:MAG: hypothetical protein ACI805_002074, partial [Candidatus Azotimanducaceae bacterium]